MKPKPDKQLQGVTGNEISNLPKAKRKRRTDVEEEALQLTIEKFIPGYKRPAPLVFW
jgi:hypothetical protein